MFRKGAAQFGGQFLGIVLALLVSHLIARRMGIGPEADALLLGRRLITAVSEMLNQVLVLVFIPVVAAQIAGGARLGRIVLRSAGPAFLLGVVLATTLFLATPAVIGLVAPTLPNTTQALATDVIALFVWTLPPMIATIAVSAYCNVHGVFGPTAAIRQVPRMAIILALALGSAGAIAVTAAWAYALATWLVLIGTLGIAVIAHRGSSDVDEAPGQVPEPPAKAGLGRRGTAAIVLAIGALVAIWLETAVAATRGTGAITLLDFAQRIGALLGNTLATALGLVVFADMSRRFAQGRIDTLGPSFRRAVTIGFAAIVPVTTAVILNAGAIVELLLGYGRFAHSDGREDIVLLIQLMAVAPIGALILRMMLARIIAEDGLPVVRLIGSVVVVDLLGRIGLFATLVPSVGLIGIPIALILSPILPIVMLGTWLSARGTFSGSIHKGQLGPVAALSGLTALSISVGVATASAVSGGIAGKTLAALQLTMSGGFGLLTLAVSAFVLRARLRSALTAW
ncbi:lipid II flippase MurJ [Jannaschia sp. LMIT008]|uniref:lipid II flippase MurJ n=1 Tax=Jannaschia maritima TaxID=3032585 RepID=UPI002810D463|nr:lipid II flippase MurJ [Jannaschia sp. LMIT008]